MFKKNSTIIKNSEFDNKYDKNIEFRFRMWNTVVSETEVGFLGSRLLRTDFGNGATQM